MSISAKISDGATSELKRVVIVIYPGVTLLDAAGPAQVFSSANTALERVGEAPYYEVVLMSPLGGDIETDTGVVLKTASLLDVSEQPIDTLVVSGGEGVFDVLDEAEFLEWISKAFGSSRRMATTCMGAFVAANAGLLNGRNVSTHWRYTTELQRQCPEANVQKDPLFVRDGKLWSAAGVTAGIDLSLAMVEEDHGHQIAMQVAQALVVFFKRPGGQSQFSDVLAAQQEDEGGKFTRLLAWIASNLHQNLDVETLAHRAGMSPRTFARKYTQRIGVSPAKSIEMFRVEAAKQLLMQGELPFADIAINTGLTDEQRLRRAFLRHVGVSPADYRKKFGTRLVEKEF
ncbi:GlxA family transcriptional regulator [Roseovarius aestuarii]|nr:helix-turn-helix domain-containing protein [Roseovarius aestuarii]